MDDLIFLSLALAVDVFCISFAYGLILKQHRMLNQLKLALTGGIFQGLMPIIGFQLAFLMRHYIEAVDDLLVFLIFFLLSLKTFKEAFSSGPTNLNKTLNFKTLIVIGIATSMDALFSGTTLFLWKEPLLLACFIIGLGSFLAGIAGFNLHIFFKKLPQKYLEIIAGLILMILAFKSLYLYFDA